MENEEIKQPTGLELAEKAYQEALAKRQQAQEQSIRSYQDIIDRMAPPETIEQQAERERKETNKRNLLGLIQLGANIGNLVNATTRGSHGGRSVATPDLVGAYDTKLKNDLTQRMQRDEQRNAIRQKVLGLQNEAAANDVAAANQRYIQAQKNDLAERQAEAKRNLELFKAQNTANENEKKRQLEKDKFEKQLEFNRDKLAAQKSYQQGMLNERRLSREQKAAENRSNNKIVPITTADNVTYNIPQTTLNNRAFLGNIMQYLPEDYRDRIIVGNENTGQVIGAYLQDDASHSGVVDGVDMFENYKRVKALLDIAQNNGAVDNSRRNFAVDMSDESGDDDYNSIYGE